MSVASEVGLTMDQVTEQAFTPKFLAAKTFDRLKGQRLTLETVRGLGPFFDSSCADELVEVRCTFWLWANEQSIDKEHDIRGAELRFLTGEQRQIVGVSGRYVYGRRKGSGGFAGEL